MKLANKSFSRPVVGNSDDVQAAFQVPIDVATNEDRIEINAIFQNGSKFLKDLIRSGTASYQIHIECGSTFYRKSFRSGKDTCNIIIPRNELHGRVDLNSVVVSEAYIEQYSPDGAHPDYGDTFFAVRPGDILAVTDPCRFDVDIKSDDLKRIGSIMAVRLDENRDDGEVRIEFGSEQIIVLLPEKPYKQYLFARKLPNLKPVTGMLFVLAVLTEAVRFACKDDSEYADSKWCRCLIRRMDELKIPPHREALEIAQLLLENPVSRSLDSYLKSFESGD